MSLKSTDISIEQVLEQAQKLGMKERCRVIKKLLGTLSVGQLEEVQAELSTQYRNAILEEEKKALVEYKYVNESFYAYLRQWGGERSNTYLGRMHFMPGVKYKLTYKKQNKVETLVSLGLERDEDRMFLGILHLSPYRKVESYLFYDKNLVLPRVPAEELMKTIFPLKELKIECLGFANDLELSNEKKYVEIIPEYLIKKINLTCQAQYEEKQDKNKDDMLLFSNEILPIEIKVQKNISSKVKFFFEQWAKLSTAIPTNPQLKVIHENGKTVLTDANAKILAEYTSSSGTLKVNSISYLKNLLQEITTNVTTSNFPQLRKEDKSLAVQWLSWIGSSPKQGNDKQLLAHLFHL